MPHMGLQDRQDRWVHTGTKLEIIHYTERYGITGFFHF